jgi:alpha-tubulin suppressor-like RCC1 family protein
MRRVGGFILMLLGSAGVGHLAGVPVEALRFVTVTAGADHACALTDGGEAYCWGSNEFGQLGSGSADAIPHPVPVRVGGKLKFTTLVAGFTHTCGIARDGAAFCWGANDNAQLGDGTSKTSPTPVRVAGEVRFRAIGPGGSHTCAVSTDGVGYCWGGNWHGQLGVGHHDGDPPEHLRLRVPTPIQTELRFRAAVAGGISSCGIALDGKAYCWGSPQEGRLGTGATDAANKFADKTVPTAVAGDVVFATVTPRSWHTCGLSSTNAVFCWGGGAHGVLGSGTINQIDSPIPTRVAAATDFSAVVSGQFHNCAFTRDGVASCWGANTDGELGDGTTRDAAAPQVVATKRRFISIAAGGNLVVSARGDVTTWGFSCAVTADGGTVFCWGDNRHGALGNGSTDARLTPVPISNPEAR